MRGSFFLAGLMLLAAVPGLRAVQREYAPGTIVTIQEHTRDRVLLYQVNTPIMTEDPYITVSVNLNGTIYDGEFLPGRRGELFPSQWQSEDTIMVRIEKHFMYLRREDGSESKFLITGKSRPQPAQESH